MNLETLMARAPVWRARESSPRANDAVSTGDARLDAELPGGGWPRAALTEILTASEGVGALRLIMPALAQVSRDGRWVAFVSPPHVPYAPALVAIGIDLAQVFLVREGDRKRMLWALEQSLRSGACGAVLAWLGQADMTTLRRLQLAAVTGDAIGFLFRPRAAQVTASPAVLRMALEVTPSCTAIEILKCRHRAPGRWVSRRECPVAEPRSGERPDKEVRAGG